VSPRTVDRPVLTHDRSQNVGRSRWLHPTERATLFMAPARSGKKPAAAGIHSTDEGRQRSEVAAVAAAHREDLDPAITARAHRTRELG